MNSSILIVDDDADACEALRLRLAYAGFEAVTVGGGQEAIERYGEIKPRIVLLDASMPDVSGFEVSRYIKDQDADPPVTIVFVSGASSPTLDYVKRCAKFSGGDHFITKPYDAAVLVDLVRRIDDAAAVTG
jgi:DNA-binding response OmpR family regulator